jgi:nitroreductase
MELKEVIHSRRAYRALEEVVVPDRMVEELSTLAGLAPSCFNKQPWRFVFVRRPEVLQKLYTALSSGNDWARKSSMIVAVVSERELDCVVKEREYYLFDTGMATALLILSATERGLVAHPIAGFDEDGVKEILQIPPHMKLITLVIVGRHAEDAGELLSEKQLKSELSRPPRVPVTEIMKFDYYEK